MRRKGLVIALLLVLVGAMAIVPVMAYDPNGFTQAHTPFGRAWTHYSIFLKAMGIVPVITSSEITFTPVTQTSKPASIQPAPGKDYVFLYPTGADKDILFVENSPGLAAITGTYSGGTYSGTGTSLLNYVINLSSGLGVIEFSNATWTLTSTTSTGPTGTFKGSFFGTLSWSGTPSTLAAFVPTPETVGVPPPATASNFAAGRFSMTGLTGVFHGPNGETLIVNGNKPAGSPFSYTGMLVTP